MRGKTVVIVAALVGWVVTGLGGMACAGEKVRGSGHVTQETHKVKKFHGVALRTSGDLYLEKGNRESLRVEAEDNLHEYLEFEVDDGILEIRTRRHVNLRPKKDIRFYLTFKELDTLLLSGSGDIEAPDLDAEELRVEVTGSGDVDTGDLEADELYIRLSGSGNIEIAGAEADEQAISVTGSGDIFIGDADGKTLSLKISGSGDVEVSGGFVDEQTIVITGSGDYDAERVESMAIDVRLSGSGNAKLHVRDLLEATITGSGDVRFHGDPNVVKSVSGSGDLRRL
jgi:hypothetical protein